MQISVDVHNYMETLIGAKLAKLEYTNKYTNEQLADLACIALNQLRPVYIRHDIDFLSGLPEEKLLKLQEQAIAALKAAETLIEDDQRKDRNHDDIPVIIPEHSDDEELQWYEEPIVPLKSQK
ncbi:competence protein ComFB [Vibrio albus]|uniref:Competence protein ComFB n=1 Tax=Vibrio albus TaxID=2200953 RepID=A0A2U3B6K2_9VIBR|nr:late competence development ComFB family protein [Vibrio albus]PWI32354.1 competence protein ComFB [Vibrio albus]